MIKFTLPILLFLAIPVHAANVTWGTLSLSDNNSGLFLTGFTNTASGSVYDINLPNFAQSDFPTFDGEVDLALTVSSDTPFAGVSFQYTGTFSGGDTAGYTQTAGALSSSNTFSSSPLLVPFTITGSPLSIDLTSIIQLFAQDGGSAAINHVQISVQTLTATPEPSGPALIALGLAGVFLVQKRRRMTGFIAPGLALLTVLAVHGQSQTRPVKKADPTADTDHTLQMSSMGQLAQQISHRLAQVPNGGRGQSFRFGAQSVVTLKPGECAKADQDCGSEGVVGEGPGGGQAEMAVAVDVLGQHIVVGYNDTRGFSQSPFSLSGVAYSDDGGATFTDGGRLPNAATGTIGTTSYPQVFGDPDIKYVAGGAGCQFVYTSIFVKGLGSGPVYTGSAQTMSIHRSTDCGHTWAGPFEVPSATNPHGTLTGVNATDAADKEFMDVDPDTNRVMMSWTNFTATTAEIRTTFSDNVMSATPPTWSAGVVVESGSLQGSVPRFAGNGSANAYVSYSAGFNDGNNIRFARSTDNGATWGAPVSLNATNYQAPDYIVGSDRIHSFPTMAVDNSGGARQGNIYVAAATNNNNDSSDVTLWRSTNSGTSFTAGSLLDDRPGNDRAQWFPAMAVDPSSGRVNVMYNDQQIAGSGDLMDMTWVYSDDGGTTWSAPNPLTSRPFHANYGNDSGQPNIGDYNMGVAQNGTFYAVYPTTPNLALFTDIQTPQNAFPYPSFLPSTNPLGFSKVTVAKAAISLGTVTFTDSGGNGFADAGDQLRLRFPLTNSLTNAALSPLTYTSVSATLSTSTPGVTIQAGTRAYPNIAAGATSLNTGDFIVLVSPGFTPGTRIDFNLAVTTAQASTNLKYTQVTGTPVATTVFSQDFNGTAAGFLPAGWATIHSGGANTVPWTTNTGFCGSGSNALFHQNREDGPTTGVSANNATRFERAATPNIAIPAGGAYVTLDFDICYNTEDLSQYVPTLGVEAFDGAHLRMTDFTPGHAALAVWAESFAENFTTGTAQSYPKHAPRSNNSAYFQDIPMWAGDSGGYKHVNLKFNGMAGTTVQLRPDYTQDANGTCPAADPANCGVAIDNIVLKSVTLKSDELSTLTLRPVAGQTGKYTGTVSSQPIAPAGGILVNLTSSNPGQTTMPASVTIPAGSQVSPTFNVVITGTGAFTITATGPSNVRSAGVVIVN